MDKKDYSKYTMAQLNAEWNTLNMELGKYQDKVTDIDKNLKAIKNQMAKLNILETKYFCDVSEDMSDNIKVLYSYSDIDNDEEKYMVLRVFQSDNILGLTTEIMHKNMFTGYEPSTKSNFMEAYQECSKALMTKL